MKKGMRIAWAQRAARVTPTLAPKTEYCLPDSRFALMMRLARMGASNRVFTRHVPGIEDDVIEVLRKIASGEVSKGRRVSVVEARAESERLAG